jgi:hypothetical protein
MASARPSSTRFCKPVRQLAHRHLADGLDLRKSMMSSTARRCSTSSRIAGPWRRSCHQKGTRILSERPAMTLSSVVMPLNRATFWKVRAIPPRAASEGASGAGRALEGDAAVGRVVEAVDAVQHRGLAGPVRPDDGADLALADVEGHVRERLDAAEAQETPSTERSTSPLARMG